jgi:colanic acid biosynthesis glycosyl transferase WcaI
MNAVSDKPFADILILTQYYSPEPGAPQIRLRAMARELGRLQMRVRVLTGMPNYPFGEIFAPYRGCFHRRETIDGIPVERVWLFAAAGRGSCKRLANYLSFTLCALPYLLLGPRPDVVFVEAQPLSLAFPAWLLKVLRRVPYVYNTPDLQCEVAAEQKWIGVNWFIGLAKSLEAFFMRQALSVTTVTHAFIRHFAEQRHIPKERISFLPNGADLEVLRPMPIDKAYARQLGVEGKKVFTYAGTHAHYQGLEILIEAAQLLRSREDLVFLLVGHGPVRRDLMQRAETAGLKNVLFRDSPFEEMARLMSITYASLVVLKDMPAARKMRLSKAIPPLACGVPIIYSGHGESARIAQKEGCAVVVEPERPEQLAQAILDLADQPAERDKMGRRGRALAEREFSWRGLVGDWVRQIASIRQGEDPRVPGTDGP